MNIGKALADTAELKRHEFTDARLIGWLNDLDSAIWKEFISLFDVETTEPEAYDPAAESINDTVLLVPDPHSEMYLLYLSSKIDYWNGDIERYNNSMLMYNAQYELFRCWYNKNNTRKKYASIEV